MYDVMLRQRVYRLYAHSGGVHKASYLAVLMLEEGVAVVRVQAP